MDLSQFKLLKEDDNCYHIGHPNGKTLVVDKAGLNDQSRGVIKKYYQGDLVEADDEELPLEVPPPSPSPSLGEQLAARAPIEGADSLGAQIAEKDPIIDPNADLSKVSLGEGMGVRAAPALGAGVPAAAAAIAPVGDNETLLGKQQADVGNYLKESQAIQGNMAKAYVDYQKAQAAEVMAQKASEAAYKQKEDALAKDMADKKIDPNRYYANQSTGNKIGAAIAIMFGALGGGLAGDNSNVALDQINKAVERDIESQRGEQAKAQNLYKMNHEAMQDDRAAHALTQNQLWTAAQAKIGMASAQMQNPAMKLKANQMIDQLEAQKIANRQKLAVMNGLSGKGGSNGAVSHVDPSQVVDYFTKDESQKNAVLKEIQQRQQLREVKTSIDKTAKNLESQFRNGLLTPNDTKAAKGAFMGSLFNVTGQRYSPEASKVLADSLFADSTDSAEEVKEKAQRRNDFFKTYSSSPVSKSLGIDLDKFGSTSFSPQATMTPDQVRIMNYAQAHPEDPKSALWLKKFGVN